jgi:outer membrane protein
MKQKRILFPVFISLIMGLVMAADSTLTLGTVVDLALKQGISTRQSMNQVSLGKLGVQQASSAFLPDLKTSLSSSAGKTINSEKPWSSSVDASLGLAYNYLPSSMQSYQAVKEQSKAAEYQYQNVKNQVAVDIAQQYVKAVYALKKIEIVKNDLEYQQSKLQQIEAYRSAGKKSLADELQQKTAVAEGESALLQSQQTYGRIMLTIADMAGLPLQNKYTPDTTGFELSFNNAIAKDSSMKTLQMRNNPSVQAQEFSVSAQEHSLKSAQMSYLPTVTGSLSGDYSRNNDGRDVVTSRFSEPSARASLTVSFPIFDKFNRKQNVQKAQLTLQSEQLKLQQLEKDLSLQHEQTLYDLEIAQKQLQVADIRLDAARQSLDAVTQRYDVGASTLVEVAMVNTSYLSAVDSKLQAESNLISAYFKILDEKGQVYNFVNEQFSSK